MNSHKSIKKKTQMINSSKQVKSGETLSSRPKTSKAKAQKDF